MAESKRLAVNVRVLVHNTKKSHALLKQLGLLHELDYLDTHIQFKPNSHTSPRGRSPGRFSMSVGSGLAPLQLGDEGAKYVAPLADPARPTNLVRFSKWWTDEIARAAGGRQLTRKKVALGLANLEGGAHVDPFPDLRWADMSSGGAFGRAAPVQVDEDTVTIGVTIPLGSKAVGESQDGEPLTPVPASMRQIAYELDETLTREFSWLDESD